MATGKSTYVGRDELEQLDGLLGRAIDGLVFESANDANHARMTREAIQRILEDDSIAAIVVLDGQTDSD